MKLKTEKIGDGWWITGDEEYGPYGPYDTKAQAEDDRKGCQRTLDELAKAEAELDDPRQ